MTASPLTLPALDWERLSGRYGRRFLLSLVLAAIAASLVLVGRLCGVLEGGAGLGVAVLLVLAVPTSRDLCRRVLVAGCVVLGWTPVLWFVQLPPGFGRITVGLVLLAGALAAWVGWSDSPLQRVQRLVPDMRPVDLLLPVTVAVGLLQLAPWLRMKSAAQTLAMLFDGWDNSAHFAMVNMIRRFGATVDALPAPAGGGRWQFESYPQGFHAVVASLMELQHGPTPGALHAELLAYSQAVALVVALTTVVLVAGLCALPPLRKRPAMAAPMAAFVMAVFYFGPGATAIQGGIGNFTLACALSVAAALVAVAAARALDPWTVAALGGAVVGVAFSWVLLLALAVPAALVVLLPLRRRWLTSRAAAIVTAIAGLAVVLCLVRVLVVLGRVQAADPLTITSGGVPPVDLGLFLAGTLGTLAACWMVRQRSGAAGLPLPRSVELRVIGLSAVPISGLAVTAALIAAQVQANGRVSYYGYKFMLGVELVTLVLVLVPIAYALARVPTRRPALLTSLRVGAASLVLSVGLTQVFGFTVLGWGTRGLVAGASGSGAYAAQMRALVVTPAIADIGGRVEELQATGTVPVPAFYVDARSDRALDPILMTQWYLALSTSWTVESNDVASRIDGPKYRARPSSAVLTILASGADAVVLVPREYRAEILAELDLPILDHRVIGI